MILISHRGNLDGIIKKWENTPSYILEALQAGFKCEIDVWGLNNVFYLSHDYPSNIHKISIDFLKNNNFYIHCKNIEALYSLIELNCFFHYKDDYTLTTRGEIWTYPGKILTKKSIAVLPEISNYSDEDLKQCLGICSDYITKYKI